MSVSTPSFGILRRSVVGASLAMAAPALASPTRGLELIFIGMHGAQIHAAGFDASSGAMTMIGPVAENLRPTWAVQHPRRPILYVTDQSTADSASEGGVHAFRVDPDAGTLSKIAEARAGGRGTTHLWFDNRSSAILASNFAAGSIACVPVAESGALAAPLDALAMVGSGPNRRQAAPHPHAIAIDPTGRFALVADLGSDRVWVIPFDRRTRRLGPYDPAALGHYVAPAGSGPRHIAFHPGGDLLFLITELTAEVHTLAWDHLHGRLERVQALSLNEPDFTGVSNGAEIAISRDGRFVYASNRAENTFVVFGVDRTTKQLARVQKLPSGGDRPWHFALHPSGDWLLCANRDANALRLFRVNRRTGALADAGVTLATPMPVHVHFFHGDFFG